MENAVSCHRRSCINKASLTLLIIGMLILLSVPCAVLLFGWQWDPAKIPATYLYPFALFSQSANGVIAILFCAVLFWYLKLPLKKSLLLFIILLVTTLAGLAIKSIAKEVTDTPRPYVVWLEKNGYIQEADHFYDLPHKSAFVSQQDIPDEQVSEWQQEYWASNTGYSFPSGHTLFAAQWALTMLLLLWRKKAYLPITLTLLWAMGVEASRLILGMHWPSDLITSCALAVVMVWIASLCWDRWIFTPPNSANAPPPVTHPAIPTAGI